MRHHPPRTSGQGSAAIAEEQGPQTIRCPHPSTPPSEAPISAIVAEPNRAGSNPCRSTITGLALEPPVASDPFAVGDVNDDEEIPDTIPAPPPDLE